jgi:hypothetical protein
VGQDDGRHAFGTDAAAGRESADAVARIRQILPNAKVRKKILDLADLS